MTTPPTPPPAPAPGPPPPEPALRLRYTAASDVGMLRRENEDSAYAGPHLLAVADGVGGNVAGEVASATAIETLAVLDRPAAAEDAPGLLEAAVPAIDTALRERVRAEPALEGMSTTLTALLHTGGTLWLAHIGDSRAYLLRAGRFTQVSKDHSLVQSLLDEGRLTAEEAARHPQRSLILRALNGRGDTHADVVQQELREGDRWLLCSDGLSDYAPGAAIRDAVTGVDGTAADDLDAVAHRLIELANAGGGADNITCVLADVVADPVRDTGGGTGDVLVVGAAAELRGGPPEVATQPMQQPAPPVPPTAPPAAPPVAPPAGRPARSPWRAFVDGLFGRRDARAVVDRDEAGGGPASMEPRT